MGRGKRAQITLVLAGILVIGFGLYYLISGSLSYVHEDEEKKTGFLKPFEQTYMCPGNSAKDQKVTYKGGLGLVATLTKGLSDVSQAFNKTTLQNREVMRASQRNYLPFHLIQGSTVKWSITASGGSRPPEFYFYKYHGIHCVGVSCGPSKISIISYIFSGSERVSDDGLYYVEIYNGGDASMNLDYSFEVLHTRYPVEDVIIGQAVLNETFYLPKEGNQTYGCVFVENTHKESGPESFMLSYHLSEKDKQSKLIAAIVISAILVVIGFFIHVIAFCCV